MTDEGSAFDARTGKPELLSVEDQERYQRLFEAQATRSYLYLSLGMGIVAILLPILLVVSGGYQVHDSISSFYHDKLGATRDILVGCLCAVGVFLFLFHGLSKLENWLLNVAGVAIIGVALVPSPGDTGYGSALVHRGSAIVFFLLIGIVAIFLSKGRIKDIQDAGKKRWFATAYTVVGALMILMPVVVALVPSRLFANHSVLLAEWAGIWSFAAYWLLKTFEYRLLLGIPWTVETHASDTWKTAPAGLQAT